MSDNRKRKDTTKVEAFDTPDEPMTVEAEKKPRASRIIWVWVAFVITLLIFAYVVWQR